MWNAIAGLASVAGSVPTPTRAASRSSRARRAARRARGEREIEPMRRHRHRLLCALVICGLSANLVFAALPPPYDFTGRWSGDLTGKGVTVPVSADFMS